MDNANFYRMFDERERGQANHTDEHGKNRSEEEKRMRRGKKLSEPQITLMTLMTPITEKIKKYPGNP
jgi:hypothetical protein